MKIIKFQPYRFVYLYMLFLIAPYMAAQDQPEERPVAEKILFIGDSMTGWLSERLEAYGKENGFEVATVVWDGSTISKWGKSSKLSTIVRQQSPDAVFISLGMNDLFELNPEKRFGDSLDAIMGAIGDIPVIWVGPPSWPGHKKGEVMNDWLATRLGDGHYFSSLQLDIPRQGSKNPHPTRTGMIEWMDAAVNWLEHDGAVALPGYDRPTGEQMTRGKTFIYKRMKEQL